MKKILLSIILSGIMFGLTAQENKIDLTGNIGIGTINPALSLHIKNPAGGGAFAIERGNKLWKFSIQNTGDRLYLTNSANVGQFFTFAKEGRLGIGTSNPQSPLHIETDSWLSSLITLKDTHYSPHQIYHFQVESDGLKIKQDDTINYQFKTGGDFVVNNGNLGIGTASPNLKLHIKDPDGGAAFGIERGGKLWRFDIQNTGNNLYVSNSSNPSGSKFTFTKDGRLGIGTTSPDSKLTVKGLIHSREVKVTSTAGGADFVFENDYDLPTLDEVEKYIKKNKHLPEIASAIEMNKNGIHLAEMNIKLLQKIEELTLYTIEQQKEIERLKLLEKRLSRIEKLLEFEK